MNNHKQVHQKFHRLQSMANQLKASLHNQGIALVNKLIYGDPIFHEGQVLYSRQRPTLDYFLVQAGLAQSP